MTVEEYLKFVCDIKEVRKKSQKAHLDDLYNLVKITDVRHRLIKNLSKGYKQRVGIAQAFDWQPPSAHSRTSPPVGLDPKQIIEIRNPHQKLGPQPHGYLELPHPARGAAVCERIIVINNGRIVADGATDTLAHDLSPDHRLILRAEGPEKEMVHALLNVPGVVDAYSLGEKESGIYELSVESTPDKDIRRDVFALMARKAGPCWPCATPT